MSEHQQKKSPGQQENRTITKLLAVVQKTGLLVAIFFTLIASAFLFFVGIYQGISAMATFFSVWKVKLVLSGLIKTMDIFLAALVMMLLSLGLYDLFVVGVEEPGQQVCGKGDGFSQTLDELKNTLAKLIIIILVITFLEVVLTTIEDFAGFKILVIPVGVLLISLSLWLLKHTSKSD